MVHSVTVKLDKEDIVLIFEDHKGKKHEVYREPLKEFDSVFCCCDVIEDENAETVVSGPLTIENECQNSLIVWDANNVYLFGYTEPEADSIDPDALKRIEYIVDLLNNCIPV